MLPGDDRQAEKYIDHIPMHWEVTHIGTDDKAYNATVSLHDGGWKAIYDTDAALNMTLPEGSGYAAHTAGRNGHGFGVALAGMLGAAPDNFGAEPIEAHQLEVMCAVVAAVALKYEIDTMDPQAVYTHAEAAIRDGYFPGDPAVAGMPESGPPYRWDLERFEASAAPLSKEGAVARANILRA